MSSEIQQAQSRFNQASQTYDGVAFVQKMSAQKLSRMIVSHAQTQSLHSVLDLGCGTGHMTQALLPHCASSNFTLVDFSSNMLQQAAKKFENCPNIRYECVDFLTRDFEGYDLVVSNFAFQWADSLKKVVLNHARGAKILAFTALLAGTFDDWYAFLGSHGAEPPRKPYPTASYLQTFLTELGQVCDTAQEACTLNFSDPRALMSYLRALGASAASVPVSLSCLKKIREDLRPVSLTYQIFYAVVIL